MHSNHRSAYSFSVGTAELAVSILHDYRLDDRGSIPARGKRIFPLVQTSLEAHPACYLMGTGGKARLSVMLTTHSHLVSRSRMIRAIHSLHLGACMAVAGQLLLQYYNKM
jgi:hypothetical protein